MLRSKQLDVPHPELWIPSHRQEKSDYIQFQINEYALQKLHEYLIPEATQLFEQLTILESY